MPGIIGTMLGETDEPIHTTWPLDDPLFAGDGQAWTGDQPAPSMAGPQPIPVYPGDGLLGVAQRIPASHPFWSGGELTLTPAPQPAMHAMGYPSGQQTGAGAAPGYDSTTTYVTGDSGFKTCPPVDAHILTGNAHFIGKGGAWGPTDPITPGSAAIIPDEWGMGKGQMRPYVGQISGTVDGQPLFSGITDVIDNKDKDGNPKPPKGAPPGMPTRPAFEYLHPGRIILEVQGYPKGSPVDRRVVLQVPQQVYCPVPPRRR